MKTIPRVSMVILAALAGQGCSSDGNAVRRDAAAGSGGAASSGGAQGSGGAGSGGTLGPITSVTGSGGVTATGGSVATGGVIATGGAVVGTGGGPGSGGVLGSGGVKPGTGGSGGVGSGGVTSATGGSGGGIGPGTGGNLGGLDGGSTSGCSCASGKTTFECFCTVIPCTMTLSYFVPDAGTGAGYSNLEEYADCNLVAVSIATSIAGGVYVFDRTTGSLVGRSYESDVIEKCPFGNDSGTYRTLSAGRFPDSTCTRSRCQQGTLPAIKTCPDAGI